MSALPETDPVQDTESEQDTPMARYCPGCGRWLAPAESAEDHAVIQLPSRMWIYTNYDCNLQCSYCLAYSSPRAARRGIGLQRFRQLVDEAVALGFDEVYLTGGEPFLLPEIYDMLAYSCPRVATTVLSNALLHQGKRLQRLADMALPNLAIQVSLDDCRPDAHDAVRGAGTWARALRGIRNLQAAGIRVRVSTVISAANEAREAEIRAWVRETMGLDESHHFVRPLVRRGFSDDGMDVGTDNLVPELTVDTDGVYWHPVSTDEDMLVSDQLFPLAAVMEEVARLMSQSSGGAARTFR
jgi:sulfatase maturation enzyme AslB (radical SAM superfamily)